MQNTLLRLRLALILTPAFLALAMGAVWLVFHDQGAAPAQVLKMLGWALLGSFGVAYSITLFVCEFVEHCRKLPRE